MANNGNNIHAGVLIILQRGVEICLHLRKNTWVQSGKYALPSGAHEIGESFIQTAIRECEEELGITVKPESVAVKHFSSINYAENPNDILDVYCVVNEWGGELINTEPEKHGDPEWFALNALPENMVPEQKLAVEKLFSGDFYSQLYYKN